MRYETIYLTEKFPQLKGDNCNPKLEAYLPEPMIGVGWKNKKQPCILICPGGGYWFVCQEEAEPVAFKFLEKGYNVFVLTYSVLPHCFPQQLREVAATIELIHQKAEEWLCDVDRVAIAGFSAGGHLAAHYSNTYDCPEVREIFPNSKPVQATILGYPVITNKDEYIQKDSFENLLGEIPHTADDRFSCENLVTDKTPPTFLWHTATDDVVPVENSLLYAMELSKHRIPFELHVYPEGPHGMSTADEVTCSTECLLTNAKRAHEWIASVKKWLITIW